MRAELLLEWGIKEHAGPGGRSGVVYIDAVNLDASLPGGRSDGNDHWAELKTGIIYNLDTVWRPQRPPVSPPAHNIYNWSD